MNKPIAYIENPQAPELDLDASHTLTRFCKLVSERYNIPFHTLKRIMSRDIAGFEGEGVLIDRSGKVRRVYIQPQFSRWFVYQALPKLRSGFPLQLILKR